MKRRSARPFVVEVKHTRTSATPHTRDVERTRFGKALWEMPFEAPHRDDRADASVKSSPEIEQELPRVLERRVLPSLVPMFALQSEPTPDVEVAEPRLRRVGRPRKRIEPAPAADEPSSTRTRPDELPAVTPPAAVAVMPVAVHAKARAELGRDIRLARAERASSREAKLPAGERWKRRLPRILR